MQKFWLILLSTNVILNTKICLLFDLGSSLGNFRQFVNMNFLFLMDFYYESSFTVVYLPPYSRMGDAAICIPKDTSEQSLAAAFYQNETDS